MKKLSILIVIVSFFSLLSCSSDDDGQEQNGVNASSLIGNWKMISQDYTGEGSTAAAGTTINVSYVGETVETDIEISFTENPNEFDSSGNVTTKLTTTYDGGFEDVQTTSNEFQSSGTWEFVGNDKLKMNGEGTGGTSVASEVTSTILELTETTLKLNTIQEVNQDLGEATINQTINITVVYEKI